MKDFITRHGTAMIVIGVILFLGSWIYFSVSDKESEINKTYIEQQAMQNKAIAEVHAKYEGLNLSADLMTLAENDAVSKLREKPDYKRLDAKIQGLNSDSKSLSISILILLVALGIIITAVGAGVIQYLFTRVKWTHIFDEPPPALDDDGRIIKKSATEIGETLRLRGEIVKFFGILIITCGIIYAVIVSVGLVAIH